MIEENQKPVPKPDGEYIRLGIRSHAKGTFHEVVAEGEGLDVDTMYVVEANNLIVNITFAWEEAWAITTEKDAEKLVSHRFPQYRFHHGQYPMFYQYRFRNGRMKYNLELASPGGAGRNRVLNKTEFMKIPVIIPTSYEEEKKIGDLFANLDNLITLHQREYFPFSFDCESAKTAQKTISWEQRKLSDMVERVTRKNENLESELPLTISAQYGLIDQNEFFDKRIASRDVSGYYLLKKGEFAYNKSTSSDAPWGAVKRLDRYEMGVLSTLYIVFALKENGNIDSDFLVSYYDTDCWHKGVQAIAAEGARNHGLLNITPADYFETVLTVPSDVKEQHQIGTFFAKLDSLITLHQREYFSFDFGSRSAKITQNTLSWEQREFGELVVIERGGSPRPIDDYITDSPDGLNWVKIGDAPEQGNYITSTKEKIKPEGLSKTREVHPGDLILSNSMSFGKPYIMAIDGCIHDGWLSIKNTNNVFDLKFLCVLLGTDQMLTQYKSMAAGSTVNNLNKELVGNTTVTYPNIEEQRTIGQFFEQIESLITLHQHKPNKKRTRRFNRHAL